MPARLTGVLEAQAGSARLVLERLLADNRTAALDPVLVTARTVAAGPATARALVAWVAAHDVGIVLDPVAADATGAVEITGAWTSRRWVALVTRYFEEGRCTTLVGTRGLLGEGWDARGVNVLVDLTTATTPTAVVHTRGRALRIDPSWPEKVATSWTVVAVTERHPQGGSDWDWFVRKHAGYLAIDATGEDVDGTPTVPLPTLVPAAFGTTPRPTITIARAWPAGIALAFTLLVAALLVSGAAQLALLAGATGVMAAALGGRRWLEGCAATVLLQTLAGNGADLGDLARAVADGLLEAGRSPVGATGVRILVDAGGTYRASLDGAPSDVSAIFATALDEVLAPLGSARYVVARYVITPPSGTYLPGRAWLAGNAEPNEVIFHAVPTVLGSHGDLARAYGRAWSRWVSDAPPLYTGSAEGTGVLVAHRGADPYDVTTVLRLGWR